MASAPPVGLPVASMPSQPALRIASISLSEYGAKLGKPVRSESAVPASWKPAVMERILPVGCVAPPVGAAVGAVVGDVVAVGGGVSPVGEREREGCDRDGDDGVTDLHGSSSNGAKYGGADDQQQGRRRGPVYVGRG